MSYLYLGFAKRDSYCGSGYFYSNGWCYSVWDAIIRWVLLAICLLIFMAAVAWFLLRRRRRRALGFTNGTSNNGWTGPAPATTPGQEYGPQPGYGMQPVYAHQPGQETYVQQETFAPPPYGGPQYPVNSYAPVK